MLAKFTEYIIENKSIHQTIKRTSKQSDIILVWHFSENALCTADMENPASVQAMLADICVEKCGHYSVKQEITTKMPNYGQI